jgi:hypothetical protein
MVLVGVLIVLVSLGVFSSHDSDIGHASLFSSFGSGSAGR